MMLLEHDAKELLLELGLNVPAGTLVRSLAEAYSCEIPGVVKAQVPTGGRGKAGGIKLVRSTKERDAAVRAILGMTIKGIRVRAVRLESPVKYVAEAYISFTIDPATAKVRILLSPQGGVEVENEASRDKLLSAEADLDSEDMIRSIYDLATRLPRTLQSPLRKAAKELVRAFLSLEAIMLEINPLFVTRNGGWMIGDAKLVADDNAFERCDAIRARIEQEPDLYPEAALKLAQGFDFVRLDEDGKVGLLTTGAGLSMQLVDELTARGLQPFNFCDIRTGMFRGDPSRLIEVLGWMNEGRSIRAILVNFFAGATDLAETTRLLLIAIDRVDIKVPVVARLIGNNLDAALKIIAEAGNPITVETDLDRAIARVAAIVAAEA